MSTQPSSYAELTSKLGAQIVEQIESTGRFQRDALTRLQEALSALPTPPRVELPFASALPSPRDVIAANFAFARQVLEAQEGAVLGLIESLTPAPETPKPS